MNKEKKRTILIEVLKNITPEMCAKLTNLKEGNKNLERSDFIWSSLLGSFSTMGNSRGYFGLIKTPTNYNRVTFGALSELNRLERDKTLETVLLAAKVRMPKQKAIWLCLNYDLIIQTGGLEEVKKQALAQIGTKAKINFLKLFHGIGDKYARNIWMDVYHPDFYNTIAIDERIKQITKVLGYVFNNYAEHERFYQDIAQEVNLQGWELDRLLYNYKNEFLEKLR